LEPYEQTEHEKIFLAQPRQADWEDLGAELRDAELAVKRYDTARVKQILLRLVPELAKNSTGETSKEGEVVPIHRSKKDS
jgi:FlaA1/EpsC-like NDP-sugar epimerase